MVEVWNLLEPGVKVTGLRNRQVDIQKLFKVSEDKTLAWCTDVYELMAYMGISYIPDDWRLFIDANIESLKALLLDNENKLPAIPIAYCTDTKETYEKMDLILKKVDYRRHEWKICCDLKVVDMLCGLQGGYTKHMCFLCEWDSRHKGNQYHKHDWPLRRQHIIGKKNVQKKALVEKDKILMPPLHVKLGVVQSFVKTVGKRDEVMDVLMKLYPGLTKNVQQKNKQQEDKTKEKKKKEPRDKLKQGVLNGPDIRKLVKSVKFDAVLNGEEKNAWNAIKRLIQGFFGKHRSTTFRDDINEMLRAFDLIGVNMSLKIHYLHYHLNYFAAQLSTESEEHGERYHQTALPFESRYDKSY